ncbi:MAG: TonB-dependent receptor [Pseudomonadota bacterium]
MKKSIILTATSGIALAAVLPSTSAIAQLDQIVVTAQKRAESVNDVPIAINALDGDGLEEAGISDTDDIVEAFPNLGLNVRSSYNSGVSIRGVGTDNFHISAQQSVGTYIDDVSIVSPFVSTIGVFDMDRVEVLRGPQNTLYGRNTTGGAMVWHTKKATPGDGINGYASLGGGNGGLVEFEGALGLDLAENLAIRISGMSDHFNGLWEDAISGDATGGGYDRYGARLNLQYDVADSTSLNIGLSIGETRGEDNAYAYRGNRLATGAVDPTLSDAPGEDSGMRSDNFVRATEAEVAANPFLLDQFNQGTGLVIVNPEPGPFNRLINYSTDFGKTYVHPEAGYEAKWEGVRANLTHGFEGFADLTLLASYDETSLFGVNIADFTGFGNVQDGSWEVLQLEARLTSNNSDIFRWLVGLYYTTEESEQDTWVRAAAAGGGAGASPGIIIDSEYDNFSVYGQADYQITDALNLTAGIRFTDDKLATPTDGWSRIVCGFVPSLNGISDINRDVRAEGCPGFTPGQLGPTNLQSPSQELEEIGWKVGLDYSWAGPTLIYVSASKGFKGGAYDNRPIATGELPIGPEFLKAYEIGFKSTLADNRLQLNGATFYYDWEDLQLFDVIGGNAELLNVPKTRLIGAELEAQFAPNENWYLQAAVGYVDTEVTDADGIPAGSSVDEGDEVTNTPDLTVNVLARYMTEIAGGELSATASWRYASDYFYTFGQETTRATAPSQNYVNASLAYAFGDEMQHVIRVYGDNLTEEFHCSGLQDGPVGGFNYSCRIGSFGKRQYGVNFRTNF